MRELPRLFHVGCIEIAHSERGNLARALELGEDLQCCGERDRAAPVQQVQVNGVHSETPQAALASGNRAAARRILRVDLADQKHIAASAANRFADQLFGGALSVHLGGIDQRHAEVDSTLQRHNLS